MTIDQQQTPYETAYTHNAFRVEGQGKKANWIKIGNVFTHNDGKGLDLVHRGLTEDIRIVIRERKEQQ